MTQGRVALLWASQNEEIEGCAQFSKRRIALNLRMRPTGTAGNAPRLVLGVHDRLAM